MSSVLQKVVVFEDYEEMNDAILEKLTQPLWNMQKVTARKTRTAVMVKVAATNLTNLHQRKDANQIYQVCSKLLGKTVTMMMIMFLWGVMMMMMTIMTKTEMKKKIKRTEVNK